MLCYCLSSSGLNAKVTVSPKLIDFFNLIAYQGADDVRGKVKDAPSGYTLAIAIILWFTVLFANFAEAIAEGRGKAQADSLRASRKDVDAHKIPSVSQKDSVTVVPSALRTHKGV